MPDWNHLVRGIDVSHYQGKPDWSKVLATGIGFAMIKCAEAGGIDSEFERNRQALSGKILWLPYAFLRPGDTNATIDVFCNAVGQTGIPAALDWEAAHVSATVVERWIDRTEERLGHSPLVYYGLYPPDTPTPAIRHCLRWYPQYPGSDTANSRIPPWNGSSPVTDWSRRWVIWQWSDTGQIDGINGRDVDLNRLSCPLDTFKAWYEHDRLVETAPPALEPAARSLDIHRVLRIHATGEDVAALQERLVGLGFAIEIDGIFGPETQNAVAEFQASRGLQADGVVGPITLESLER
jgi:GH25 family lysozyme M1 (1,4-beta-N-acetylmuramidase)